MNSKCGRISGHTNGTKGQGHSARGHDAFQVIHHIRPVQESGLSQKTDRHHFAVKIGLAFGCITGADGFVQGMSDC